MNALENLQHPNPIWRPYAFDRVEVTGRKADGSPVAFSLLGFCYSEYDSGPNLCRLADAAGVLVGAGCFGLKACRARGSWFAKEVGVNYGG